MRLFVAVVPPADAIGQLDRAAADVRMAYADLAWIPTERWHLTLAFYGEVADRDVARVERRGLRATKRADAMDLKFAGAGHFADRVLWVGVGGERDGLRDLAGALATEGRPYRPHLTLARARRGGDPRARRGGDRQAERGGDRQAERGGDPQAERGGDPQAGRGGDPQAGRGDDPQAGRGDDPQAGRGDDPQAGRGGDPRARRGGDPRAAAAMLATYDGPGWRAAEVVLFRSHLGPRPTHEPLARWPLATP